MGDTMRFFASAGIILFGCSVFFDLSAQEARDALRAGRLPNEIEIEYEYEEFDEVLEPWHLYKLEYTRRTGKGSIIGRVNLAERFGRSGTQYEVDAYPRLRQGTYAYVSAGYSEDSIFPEWRYGAQIYQSLPRSWELSVGARRLEFSSSNVTLYTGSIGKYKGNYYTSLQPYVRKVDEGYSTSGVLTIRRYYSSADDYLTFRGSYGESPEIDIFLEEEVRTTSWSLKLEGRKKITERFLIEAQAAIRDQEIRAGTRRESFSVSAAILRRF